MASVPLKRARQLMLKPKSEWTKNDKDFMNAYCGNYSKNKEDDFPYAAPFIGMLLGLL